MPTTLLDTNADRRTESWLGARYCSGMLDRYILLVGWGCRMVYESEGHYLFLGIVDRVAAKLTPPSCRSCAQSLQQHSFDE
jgi:hypothetical protein